MAHRGQTAQPGAQGATQLPSVQRSLAAGPAGRRGVRAGPRPAQRPGEPRAPCSVAARTFVHRLTSRGRDRVPPGLLRHLTVVCPPAGEHRVPGFPRRAARAAFPRGVLPLGLHSSARGGHGRAAKTLRAGAGAGAVGAPAPPAAPPRGSGKAPAGSAPGVVAIKTDGPWGRAGALARAAPFPGGSERASSRPPCASARPAASEGHRAVMVARGLLLRPLPADARRTRGSRRGALPPCGPPSPAPRWYLQVTWCALLGPCPQISSRPGPGAAPDAGASGKERGKVVIPRRTSGRAPR